MISYGVVKLLTFIISSYGLLLVHQSYGEIGVAYLSSLLLTISATVTVSTWGVTGFFIDAKRDSLHASFKRKQLVATSFSLLANLLMFCCYLFFFSIFESLICLFLSIGYSFLFILSELKRIEQKYIACGFLSQGNTLITAPGYGLVMALLFLVVIQVEALFQLEEILFFLGLLLVLIFIPKILESCNLILGEENKRIKEYVTNYKNYWLVTVLLVLYGSLDYIAIIYFGNEQEITFYQLIYRVVIAFSMVQAFINSYAQPLMLDFNKNKLKLFKVFGLSIALTYIGFSILMFNMDFILLYLHIEEPEYILLLDRLGVFLIVAFGGWMFSFLYVKGLIRNLIMSMLISKFFFIGGLMYLYLRSESQLTENIITSLYFSSTIFLIVNIYSIYKNKESLWH